MGLFKVFPNFIDMIFKHMKCTLKLFTAGIFILFIATSCATTQGAKVEQQREAYMLQDKSEYSRNKGKYKGSGSYDKTRKKSERMQKRKKRKAYKQRR
jgi:hypothetical protein